MKIGKGTTIHPLSNIYCEEIGDNCSIANFVEIGAGVRIGSHCTIQAFAFIPQGVIIRDNVFVGPHVCFTNCRYPSGRKKYLDHGKMTYKDSSTGEILKFKLERTFVDENVSIGAGAVILCGITIGKNSVIGAGCLVLKDIPAYATVKDRHPSK